MEIDLDISVSQFSIGNSDSTNSILKEMLFWFVQSDLGEWRSVKSDSDSVSDDDAGKEKLVKDGRVDGCQGSAVGSLQFSILFNPSWLNASGWEQKDSFFESLLEFGN